MVLQFHEDLRFAYLPSSLSTLRTQQAICCQKIQQISMIKLSLDIKAKKIQHFHLILTSLAMQRALITEIVLLQLVSHDESNFPSSLRLEIPPILKLCSFRDTFFNNVVVNSLNLYFWRSEICRFRRSTVEDLRVKFETSICRFFKYFWRSNNFWRYFWRFFLVKNGCELYTGRINE